MDNREHALIELHGSFAETGRGHGTDLALVAGLLDLETDDPHIRDSFDLAAEAGMKIEFTVADLGTDANPNSVRLTMEKDGRSVRLIGSSVGGGRVEICCIQDYEIQFSGENETLLVVAEDRPGHDQSGDGLATRASCQYRLFAGGAAQARRRSSNGLRNR